MLVSTAAAWGLAWTERLMPEVFQKIPFSEVAWFLTAFVCGGIAADLTNPTRQCTQIILAQKREQ